MSIELLDKTRKINKLLHTNNSHKLAFSELCLVLSDVLSSNVLVISRKGKILAVSKKDDIQEIENFGKESIGTYIDQKINDRLLAILSTKENVNINTLGLKTDKSLKAIISPIDISERRLATLFIYNDKEEFDIEDIILAEYGSAVVGIDMIRSMTEELREEKRNLDIIKSAISTLSYSEIDAIKHVFLELKNTEGIIIASKIADRVGITRSVIVNALRKFESAGIIESKSSGMRGTYIKVQNEFIFEELEKMDKIQNR